MWETNAAGFRFAGVAGMCGGRRGWYGASLTLEQVWYGGSKQEGVQRRCLESDDVRGGTHRQQLLPGRRSCVAMVMSVLEEGQCL